MSQAVQEDQPQDSVQQAEPPRPSPDLFRRAAAPPPQDSPAQNTDNPDGDKDGRGRAGGAAALRTDLARERDQRQAAQQQIEQLRTEQQAFRDQVAQALGLQPAQTTPEQLREQLTASQADAASRARELAVYRLAGPLGANVDLLTDSTMFHRSISDVDPADSEKLKAAITEALERNPAYRAGAASGQGHRDAAGGATPPATPPSMDDLLRGIRR